MDVLTTVLTSLGTSGLFIIVISLVVRPYLERKFDNHFANKLEQHKHQMNLLAEHAKFDYRRKIEDFSLYTRKKHEVYLELYKLLQISYSKLFNLAGIVKEIPDFMKYDKNEIDKFLIEKKLLTIEKDIILQLWDNNRREAVNKIHIILNNIELREAKNAYIRANNLFVKSKVYFSDPLIENVSGMIEKYNDIFIIYSYPFSKEHNSKDAEDKKTIKNALTNYLEEITTLMRKELTIGYYEKDNNIS